MKSRIYNRLVNGRTLKSIFENAGKMTRLILIIVLIGIIGFFNIRSVNASWLKAGVAKVNITNVQPGELVIDSLYVKALILDDGSEKFVLITVDAVAIGRIGSIGNDYLKNVRSGITEELGIDRSNIMVNASHLHGAGYHVSPDIEKLTIQAVRKASKNMMPVSVGAGTGYEDRITENHILKLKNGKGWAIRHANPMPPCEEVEGIGPIDPEIGILRLDKKNGETLAVVYNFTGHPYQAVSGTGTTSGYYGFASDMIEDNLSEETIALFVQGFSGDVIPILYKDVHSIRSQEPLGNMLGLSVLEAVKKIDTDKRGELKVIDEVIKLPRRTDFAERLASMKAEQQALLRSLRSTSLNIKTFIPLYIKYNLHEEYPSYYSHRYMHDEMIGRDDMKKLDEENRRNINKYLKNIYAMEKLARLQYNISLVEDRKAKSEASGEKTIDVEIQAIKIGNFIMVTFPAEVSVQVGLNIKSMSPFENTFVAGYTNGYIHYTPTAEQIGCGAYQDHSCLLAPEWQKIYEEKVMEMLNELKE
jgi:hypothetical protein